MARLIAVTGGIGCGKSVVCKVLAARGYDVVDTDALARAIMDSSNDIKERLRAQIHPKAVDSSGAIDRRLIADIVFADSNKLAALNRIVHSAVLQALAERCCAPAPADAIFVETALLFQSGLNRRVEAELRVEAPIPLRIERVMARNGLSRSQVENRIASQNYDVPPTEPQPRLFIIRNGADDRLLPQIDAVLGLLSIPPLGLHAHA